MGTWTWQYEDAEGRAVTLRKGYPGGFPSQADAESWIGEVWRELLEAGVEQVRLRQDDDEVYGPMSLRPAG